MVRQLARRVLFATQRRSQHLDLLAEVGSGSIIEPTAKFAHHAGIMLGRHVRIGPNCFLSGEGKITVGDGTILAPNVVVLSGSHRWRQERYLPYDDKDDLRPVAIGRGVWLGWGALVSPGVTLGDGSVVGMGAVVTKDVAPGDVVAGNPATVIGQRDSDNLEEMVAGEKWWLRAIDAGEVDQSRGRH